MKQAARRRENRGRTGPGILLAMLLLSPLAATGEHAAPPDGIAVADSAGPTAGPATGQNRTPSDPGHTATPRDSAPPDTVDRALDTLRAWEDERRAAADFGALPPGNRVRGPDPFDLVALPGGGFAGILRGRDAVVVLDERLAERARFDAPPSPTTIVRDGHALFVSGELSNALGVYRIDVAGAVSGPAWATIPGLVGARALAVLDAGRIAVADELTDRLVLVRVVPDGPGAPRVTVEQTLDAPRGTIHLERAGSWLLATGVLEHAVWLYPIGPDGRAGDPVTALRHDGPIWCAAARETAGGLLVATGGVEDRPLDRSGGFFGHIDSFAFVDRVRRSGDGWSVERVDEVNLGEHGLLTPKWIAWNVAGTDTSLLVAGYGGERLARLAWPDGFAAAASPRPPAGGAPVATVTTIPVPAGLVAGHVGNARMIFADPLLDAWVRLDGGEPHLVPVPDPAGARDPDARLGEALFFTGLMAPENRSDGARSRFSCETCHFEGYGDGRTHYTGRGAVHATTKPLAGLFNNRPHFSRALDPDLTAMVHNEFRVSGAENGSNPWFSLDLDARPWLALLAGRGGEASPQDLRRALAAFLMEFTHVENPWTRGRMSWTATERAGAALFRDRCEGCHEARLVADDPASQVPFADWERRVFSPAGPIAWAAARYAKTGVEPYVHEDGARIASLRRLARKRPYFTDGSAATLEEALENARFGPGIFRHRPAAPDSGWVRLGAAERDALAAFLRTL